MISLLDRASIECARNLALDPRLRDHLTARIAKLATPYGDLTDLTHFVVVEPGDTEADIVREAGFSPLVNPLNSTRYGMPDFQSWWDGLLHHDGWFEMIVCVGDSGFAYVLFIQDADGVDAELLSLCRSYAS